MRTRSAGRELAFVVGVAAAGLALVLIVVFAPWYTPAPGPAADATPAQLVSETDRSLPTTP